MNLYFAKAISKMLNFADDFNKQIITRIIKMIQALKVMILEDQPADQELVKRQVLKYQPKSMFLVAEDRSTFFEKLDWFLPDLILGDYHLPDFNGLDALVHVKEHKPFVPFVFVTGGLNPSDPVAEVVLKIADGFVLKDDLDTLHLRLAEIMQEMKIKVDQQKEKLKVDYDRKVNLLKSIELLQAEDGFAGKAQILEILNKL